MKQGLWLLVIVIAMMAAASIAPLFLNDAGYVLLEFADWHIETSVMVLIAGLISLFLIFRIIAWFLSLPARAARNLAQRRLEQGLLALAEGDWRRAENALSKSANPSGLQRAGYLAAARAASGQLNDEQAENRQEQYLLAADDGKSQTQFLVELSRARLHMAKQDYLQATHILKKLRKQRRQHKQTLQMLATCYREQDDWSAFRQILPNLRKVGLIDRQAENDLQIMTSCNELQAVGDIDALQQHWEALLRPQRQQAEIISAYANQAIAFGKPRLAEGVLLKALDKKLHPGLLDIYADCHTDEVDKPLLRAEKWREKNPNNAAIERLLGKLCLKKQLWGKARTHLLDSIKLQADKTTYELLGNLLQRQGELEVANICYYNALQLANDKPDQVQAINPAEPQTTPQIASSTALPTDQNPSLPAPSASDVASDGDKANGEIAADLQDKKVAAELKDATDHTAKS